MRCKMRFLSTLFIIIIIIIIIIINIIMINFLVVDLPYNKPPLLCGKDAQALDYLRSMPTKHTQLRKKLHKRFPSRKVDKGGRVKTLLERIQAGPRKTSRNPHAHLS